jgi:protein-disulfide isomerase
MSKETKIISSVGIIFFALFVLLIYKTNNGGSQVVADANLLLGQASYMTGKKEAKVNVVEFGDYQCPACGYANPIVEQLIQAYKNDSNVNFVFRNFPLPQHSNALISAEAAQAAGAQGKFWEMHNMIYSGQNDWSENSKALEIFTGYAQKLGLDVKTFTDAVSQQKFQDNIFKDRSDGQALGVNATPTFYVNGEKLNGIPSLEDFKKLIDGKLK